MHAIEVLPADQSTTHHPVWHQHRRHSIGGSDAAAALGVDPWNSPWALWTQKHAAADNCCTPSLPDAPDPATAARFDWGHRVETAVADWFADQLPDGHQLHRVGLLRHPHHPWLTCTPDRLILDAAGTLIAGLEIKNSARHDGWADDQIPDRVMAQVVVCLAVTGLDTWHVAAQLGGNPPTTRTIHRDLDVERDVLARLGEWWQTHVVAGTPPDPDNHPATTAALQAAWDADDTATAELDGDLVARWRTARAAAKHALETEEEAANAVRAALGPATVGTVNGEPVCTWRAHDTTRIDHNLVRADPNWRERYAVTTTTRTLRTKGP